MRFWIRISCTIIVEPLFYLTIRAVVGLVGDALAYNLRDLEKKFCSPSESVGLSVQSYTLATLFFDTIMLLS